MNERACYKRYVQLCARAVNGFGFPFRAVRLCCIQIVDKPCLNFISVGKYFEEFQRVSIQLNLICVRHEKVREIYLQMVINPIMERIQSGNYTDVCTKQIMKNKMYNGIAFVFTKRSKRYGLYYFMLKF